MDLAKLVEQRTIELRVLYEISKQASFLTNYDDLLSMIVTNVQKVIRFDVVACIVETQNRHELSMFLNRDINRTLDRFLLHSIVDYFLPESPDNLLDETLLINRTKLFEQKSDIGKKSVSRLQSLMFLPVRIGDGAAPIGVFLIGAEREDAFNSEERRLLTTIANHLAYFIQRLRSFQDTESQRLESMVENFPEGVIMLSNDMHIMLANPPGKEYLKLLGNAEQGQYLKNLNGKPISHFRTPPKILPFHEVNIREPVEGIFEVKLVRIKTFAWLLLIRDVTLEREKMRGITAQDRLAALGQMASGIAHDFSNHLTGILGLSELIASREDLPEDVLEDVQQITDASRRSAFMIRQILDFTRKSPARKQPQDILPNISETIQLLKKTLPENIQIYPEYRLGDFTVNSDQSAIQQILTNLIMNARDAMPDGGTISVTVQPLDRENPETLPFPELEKNDWAELRIEDKGTGISTDILPYIFDPFYTTKDPSRGTGLGLSQVYGLVKQHAGFIEVDSTLGKGTLFRIFLPLCCSQAKIVKPTPPKKIKKTGNGQTILLVEDEQPVLNVSKRILERLGYNVMIASNGEDGLNVFESNNGDIDLIITDMVMPVMGGLQLIQTLQQNGRKFKAIVLSGYPLEDDWEEVWGNGVVGWMQKPPVLDEFKKAVVKALES